MPWTLYKYILRELLKVLGASAAILTAVMSVAFAIMSVTEAQLGPLAMVKIVLLVLPGMLTVALPFAAALAGTLVFFRMSQDNEVTACAVGGISYMGLLAPVLVLGLILTGSMFWFSNWIVPRFWRMAEREGTSDVVRLAMRQVQQRQLIAWEGMLIRADAAQVQVPETAPDTPAHQRPYSRLMLQGVAVGRVDENGAVDDAYTARTAVIDLFRDEDEDRISATMLLEHVSRNDPKSGTMPYVGTVEIGAIEVPSFFQDRPQFMSLDRLRRLAAEPQRSTEVRKARRTLVLAMAKLDLFNQIEWWLSGPDRSVEMVNLLGRRLRIESPGVQPRDKRLVLRSPDGGGRIVVTEFIGDLPRETLSAESGYFEPADAFDEGEPRVNLTLNQVAEGAGADARLAKVDKLLLSLREPVLAPLRKLTLTEVLNRADRYQNKRIETLRDRVTTLIARLQRNIVSRLHERAATTVNCALVLMLGAVMSIRLRHRTPLTIFFWCFMPTVAAFLMISSGRHMTSWSELPIAAGLGMTWAGNALLALLVLGVYARLRRN